MRHDASVAEAAEPLHQWKFTNKKTNTGLIWACSSTGTSQAYPLHSAEGMELLEITRKGAENRIASPEVFIVPSHCPISLSHLVRTQRSLRMMKHREGKRKD